MQVIHMKAIVHWHSCRQLLTLFERRLLHFQPESSIQQPDTMEIWRSEAAGDWAAGRHTMQPELQCPSLGSLLLGKGCPWPSPWSLMASAQLAQPAFHFSLCCQCSVSPAVLTPPDATAAPRQTCLPQTHLKAPECGARAREKRQKREGAELLGQGQ